MFCMTCGQELPSGAKFCPQCGKEAMLPSAEVRRPMTDRPPATGLNTNSPSLFSKAGKLAGSAIFWIVLLIASVIGGIAGKALVKGGIRGPATQNPQSDSMSAEQMTVQHVDAFAVNYAHPFIRSEKESRDMRSAVEAQVPGLLQSVDIFTSSPSCGLGEVRLVVGTYVQGTELSIDGSANGSVSQISTLNGITSPESTITPATVSGHPARRTSYRAKRWGGVLGGEFIAIADSKTNTVWQLQLIFSARSTNDYNNLNNARSCAQKILESVAIKSPLANPARANGMIEKEGKETAALEEDENEPKQEAAEIDATAGIVGMWEGWDVEDEVWQTVMNIKRLGADYKVALDVRGPGCIGSVDGTATLSGNILTLVKEDDDQVCTITARIEGTYAYIAQDNCSYYHGAACDFGALLNKTP